MSIKRSDKLILREATTQVVKIFLTDPDEDELPFDLTGRTIKFAAKRKIEDDDDDVIFDLDVAISDAAEGRGQVTINGDLLTPLLGGTWEIRMWETLSPADEQLPDQRVSGILDVLSAVVRGGFSA